MENFNLSKPFTLSNGNTIKALKLNFEDLTTADLRQIRKLEAQVSDNAAIDMASIVKDKALSFEFQLATGFLAAMKGTEGLQISDFLLLPMQDALELAKVASFFCLCVD